MKHSVIVLICSLMLLGCEMKESSSRYIVTPKGIVSHTQAYCILGMLLSNDKRNILDVNSNPITCSGIVRLTRNEAKNYGN